MQRDVLGKVIIACLAVVVLVGGGAPLVAHRRYKEPVVLGPGVTKVARLSDWFDGLRGTANDSLVYILEGEREGGNVLILGGSHPGEVAGTLAAIVAVENAVVEAGKVFIIPHINRSGSTGTQPGGGYPLYYHIPTEFGARKFRVGDRVTHPLDQWPDPDVFIHYPSGQSLSYVEVRNINRCWPGRPDGLLTEKTTYAAMELVRRENINIVIDMHEAELLYPVTNCIVAPSKSLTIASMVAINLSAMEFDIHTEPSPPGYHGLTHREVGDHSDAYPFLLEAPEPFLDQPTGPKTESLLIDGVDEFLLKLGEKGLLFVDYDETGKPLKLRVGRHLTTTMSIFEEWSAFNPDYEIVMNCPGYAEIMENGVGYYLRDPSAAGPGKVMYE
ncbi:MAG: succinylglutamate desuccinylase [Firmicutes bacterium]|jgi:predicted deacylase|nr:succinylglutamate desuccinylase [Bacillota bacterium]